MTRSRRTLLLSWALVLAFPGLARSEPPPDRTPFRVAAEELREKPQILRDRNITGILRGREPFTSPRGEFGESARDNFRAERRDLDVIKRMEVPIIGDPEMDIGSVDCVQKAGDEMCSCVHRGQIVRMRCPK